MHCLWPKQRENNSAKTSMALKLRIFSPANLSPSTVYIYICICIYLCACTHNLYVCVYYAHTYMRTHACSCTHAHTYLYVRTHTCIAVYAYMNFCLLMEVGMIRVYRILRVMPQPTINIPNISFVTNYGKVRNYIF